MTSNKRPGRAPVWTDRIFYRSPRNWLIWNILLSVPAMILYVLVVGFTIALINLP